MEELAIIEHYFPKPIPFKCVIDGVMLDASLVSKIEEGICFSFRIKFSDGVEDCLFYEIGDDVLNAPYDYSINAENVILGDRGEESVRYGKAIEHDLAAFRMINENSPHPAACFRKKIDGQESNVWVIDNSDDNGNLIFVVFNEGDYWFQMEGNYGNWVERSVRVGDARPIDQDVANFASLFIDTTLI